MCTLVILAHALEILTCVLIISPHAHVISVHILVISGHSLVISVCTLITFVYSLATSTRMLVTSARWLVTSTHNLVTSIHTFVISAVIAHTLVTFAIHLSCLFVHMLFCLIHLFICTHTLVSFLPVHLPPMFVHLSYLLVLWSSLFLHLLFVHTFVILAGTCHFYWKMCHYGYLNLPIFIHSKEKDDIEDVKTTGILAHNEVRDLVVHAMIEKRQSETDKKKETKRTSSAKKPGKHPTNK